MTTPVQSHGQGPRESNVDERIKNLEKELEALRKAQSGPKIDVSPVEREHWWGETRLQILFDFTDQGIIVTDSEGRVVKWNRAVERMTGIPRDQVLGDFVWNVQYRLAVDELRESTSIESVRQFWVNSIFTMNDDDLYTGNGRVINAEGEEEYVQDMIRPVVIDGSRYYCSFQNYITRLKETEEELRKKVEELAVANRELEIFTYANNDLKQFAYTASHQLQEPIRTVSNYTKILEEDYSGILDEKAMNYLYIVRYASERMSVLINSLLEYSRLGRKSNLMLVNCREVINGVIEDLSYMIQSSGAVIRVENMPVIYLYENEFRQLIYNLLNNALKFRKSGIIPDIVVQAEKHDDKYVFSVRDNGIGIDPRHNERIFEIFQRLHINEEEYEGKGVGLALCKKIVSMHNGRIWVESVEGSGSDFRFSIPIN